MQQLVAQGTSRVNFDVNKQIDTLDFHTHDHIEYIKRTMMEQLHQGSPELMKSSPGNRLQKRPQPQMPPSATNYYGVPPGILQLLEVCVEHAELCHSNFVRLEKQSPRCRIL